MTTTVATVYPVIAWASGVSGAGTIWVSGTPVDNTLVTAVQAAATAANIPLAVGTLAVPAPTVLLTKSVADTLYDPIGAGGGSSSYIVDGGTP